MNRYKVSPKNITVNGWIVTPKHPAWLGLDMSKAEPRQNSALMMSVLGDAAPVDAHLSVPFQHPSDTTNWGVSYRVRPRMEPGGEWRGRIVKSVAFERWDGEWYIAVGYE